MRLKLKRKNGIWLSAVLRGNGGVSSQVAGRGSQSLWYVLGVFKLKNILKALH
jgi:hypothetical protein